MMYPSANSAIPNEDFTLIFGFDNSESGVLDIKPHLGFGVFRLLADYENFKQLRVSFDTVNGTAVRISIPILSKQTEK